MEIQPVAREIVEWDEYIGRLEAPETVEIRARVNGYLDKVHFKEGKEVKKGDLLFTFDRRPYQAEFDRADVRSEDSWGLAPLALPHQLHLQIKSRRQSRSKWF